MEIAFFIPKLGIGGAERTVVRLANSLQTRGESVKIIVAEVGELTSEVDEEVDIVELDPDSVPLGGVLRTVPALSNFFAENDVDIIVSFTKHANIAALLSYRIASPDFPIVVSERNHLSRALKKRNPIRKWTILLLMQWSYRRADHIIAVSQGVGRDLCETVRISPDSVTTIHNPVVTKNLQNRMSNRIDHRWFLDDNINTILGVGRLAPQKDYETLLAAFSIIVKERPNVRLVIFGEGERRDDLQASIRKWGLQDLVELPGEIQNPYPYMRAASVFVLSSAWEGLPNVLIEAMMCGCPVVSTDCPSGPKEILQDGKYGPLVPVGNEKRLAEAVVETLEDPLCEATLQERARDFSNEEISAEYLELFRDVLST